MQWAATKWRKLGGRCARTRVGRAAKEAGAGGAERGGGEVLMTAAAILAASGRNADWARGRAARSVAKDGGGLLVASGGLPVVLSEAMASSIARVSSASAAVGSARQPSDMKAEPAACRLKASICGQGEARNFRGQ